MLDGFERNYAVYLLVWKRKFYSRGCDESSFWIMLVGVQNYFLINIQANDCAFFG